MTSYVRVNGSLKGQLLPSRSVPLQSNLLKRRSAQQPVGVWNKQRLTELSLERKWENLIIQGPTAQDLPRALVWLP